MQLRAGWQLDAQTTLVVCDPTSPNILQFRAGRDVNRVLSRPFFVELQSRYGNLYYVREEVRLSAPLAQGPAVAPAHGPHCSRCRRHAEGVCALSVR